MSGLSGLMAFGSAIVVLQYKVANSKQSVLPRPQSAVLQRSKFHIQPQLPLRTLSRLAGYPVVSLSYLKHAHSKRNPMGLTASKQRGLIPSLVRLRRCSPHF